MPRKTTHLVLADVLAKRRRAAYLGVRPHRRKCFVADQPPDKRRQRLFLIVFIALAALMSLTAIFGGLDNWQRLYEAGHQDPFGQTIGQRADPPPAEPQAP